MDQIQDELAAEEEKGEETVFEIDDDLPGQGQFYCTPCARHFTDAETKRVHIKSKLHKRRRVIVELFHNVLPEFGVPTFVVRLENCLEQRQGIKKAVGNLAMLTILVELNVKTVSCAEEKPVGFKHEHFRCHHRPGIQASKYTVLYTEFVAPFVQLSSFYFFIRMKDVAQEQYTQAEAERAAGMTREKYPPAHPVGGAASQTGAGSSVGAGVTSEGTGASGGAATSAGATGMDDDDPDL